MPPGRTASARPTRRWLLLSRDPAWPEAVRQELGRLGGGDLAIAQTPQDALHRLVEPNHCFTHLLLEPSAAGGHARDLLGVTSGEAGSQVTMLLLGDKGEVPGHWADRHAATPADLHSLLSAGTAAGAAETADANPLSTADIAIGFDAENLECRFQPIVRLLDRRPVGIETLVRMLHPQRGTIGPDQFIPQIERGGLSLRLTEAVAQGAMRAINPALLDAHDLYVTLNLPLDVLLFPEALERIDVHRAAAGIPVERVLIELTESRPVVDLPGLSAAMDRWRGGGYRVAIDDLGPEMMNQIELFDLPFNVVKLDKQIVLRSEHDPLARRYLQRTVANAHSRSLSVIAEGIENEAMWNRMRDLGVEHAQGFLIARAMPASALPSWLAAWSAQGSLPPDRVPT